MRRQHTDPSSLSKRDTDKVGERSPSALRAAEGGAMRKAAEAILLFLWAMAATAVYSGEIVVAQVAPFSGGIEAYSNDTFLGAYAYFEALNARGGVNGNRLHLVKRDDRMV